MDVLRSWSNKNAILQLISEGEVTEVLQGMGTTAAGLDKIEAKCVLQWHQPSLAGYFNLLMVLEKLPTVLTRARVVFIKKIDQTKVPGDYRPISITSAITRAFHRILAHRLCHSLTFLQLQYAFLQKNGCLEVS